MAEPSAMNNGLGRGLMTDIRRVGIVFSGGPAPGANAVISAAASSFLEAGVEVYGIFHGIRT